MKNLTLKIARIVDFTVADFVLMKKYVSEERKKRIERFYFEEDKQMGILSEVMVRSACHFQGLLKKESSGMPYVKHKNGSKSFCSISHSDGIVFIAYSDDYAIGVDIQSTLPSVILTEEFFTKKEIRMVINCEVSSHALWAMKESVSKLFGLGLKLDFKEIHFERKSNNTYLTTINNKKIYTLCKKFLNGNLEYYLSVSFFNEMHILPIKKVKCLSELL